MGGDPNHLLLGMVWPADSIRNLYFPYLEVTNNPSIGHGSPSQSRSQRIARQVNLTTNIPVVCVFLDRDDKHPHIQQLKVAHDCRHLSTSPYSVEYLGWEESRCALGKGIHRLNPILRMGLEPQRSQIPHSWKEIPLSKPCFLGSILVFGSSKVTPLAGDLTVLRFVTLNLWVSEGEMSGRYRKSPWVVSPKNSGT